jgi:hypothetical protein
VTDEIQVTIAGSTSPNTVYNTVSRYKAYDSAGGQELWIVSSASVTTGLSWSRTTTTLTITHTGHGRSTGDLIIVRNANADNFSGTITVSDSDTFTISTVNSGGTSGNAAAYSLGFRTDGTPSASAVTIVGPSGGDCQLMGLMYSTGSRSGNTCVFTLPDSVTNGSGEYSDVKSQFFPIIRVHNESTGGVLAATMSIKNTPYNEMSIGSLPLSDSAMIRLTLS